jgi:hypothetical protein
MELSQPQSCEESLGQRRPSEGPLLDQAGEAPSGFARGASGDPEGKNSHDRASPVGREETNGPPRLGDAFFPPEKKQDFRGICNTIATAGASVMQDMPHLRLGLTLANGELECSASPGGYGESPGGTPEKFLAGGPIRGASGLNRWSSVIIRRWGRW